MQGIIIKKRGKTMNAVLEKIQKLAIVPVVVLNNVEDAEPVAKALCTAFTSYFLFHEKVSVIGYAGMALIGVGCVLMNLFGSTAA